MKTRNYLKSCVLFLVAAAGCDQTLTTASRESELLSAESYTSLPEVSFKPPLAVEKPHTAVFDSTLTDLLTIEVCAVSGGNCVGAPLAVLSGADGYITVNQASQTYAALWATRDSDLAASPTLRVSVVLAGMTLASLDIY